MNKRQKKKQTRVIEIVSKISPHELDVIKSIILTKLINLCTKLELELDLDMKSIDYLINRGYFHITGAYGIIPYDVNYGNQFIEDGLMVLIDHEICIEVEKANLHIDKIIISKYIDLYKTSVDINGFDFEIMYSDFKELYLNTTKCDITGFNVGKVSRSKTSSLINQNGGFVLDNIQINYSDYKTILEKQERNNKKKNKKGKKSSSSTPKSNKTIFIPVRNDLVDESIQVEQMKCSSFYYIAGELVSRDIYVPLTFSHIDYLLDNGYIGKSKVFYPSEALDILLNNNIISQKHDITGEDKESIKINLLNIRQLCLRYSTMYKRANKKSIRFDLSFLDFKSYLTASKYCYFTGKRFKNEDGYRKSFDRVDSAEGYTKDNIVICTENSNRRKSDLSIEELGDFYFKSLEFELDKSKSKFKKNLLKFLSTAIRFVLK